MRKHPPILASQEKRLDRTFWHNVPICCHVGGAKFHQTARTTTVAPLILAPSQEKKYQTHIGLLFDFRISIRSNGPSLSRDLGRAPVEKNDTLSGPQFSNASFERLHELALRTGHYRRPQSREIHRTVCNG